MVANLASRARERWPSVSRSWHESLAIRNAEVDVAGDAARFEGDIAGALAAAPDDDRLARKFPRDLLYRDAVRQRSRIAAKAPVVRDIVRLAVHAGGDDDIRRGPLGPVRGFNSPLVRSLADPLDRPVQRDVLGKRMMRAIGFQIAIDLPMQWKVGIIGRHRKIGDLGDAARRGRHRARHDARISLVIGVSPNTPTPLPPLKH